MTTLARESFEKYTLHGATIELKCVAYTPCKDIATARLQQKPPQIQKSFNQRET